MRGGVGESDRAVGVDGGNDGGYVRQLHVEERHVLMTAVVVGVGGGGMVGRCVKVGGGGGGVSL